MQLHIVRSHSGSGSCGMIPSTSRKRRFPIALTASQASSSNTSDVARYGLRRAGRIFCALAIVLCRLFSTPLLLACLSIIKVRIAPTTRIMIRTLIPTPHHPSVNQGGRGGQGDSLTRHNSVWDCGPARCTPREEGRRFSLLVDTPPCQRVYP